jgi:hypothetical protein
MDYSFFGRLLLVKNQNLRNVTEATLNKYTECQARWKRFIREMYTVSAARHLSREQSRFVSVDLSASFNHKFYQVAVEFEWTTCNVISVSLQNENQGGLNHTGYSSKLNSIEGWSCWLSFKRQFRKIERSDGIVFQKQLFWEVGEAKIDT